jgi:hypothetical protein
MLRDGLQSCLKSRRIQPTFWIINLIQLFDSISDTFAEGQLILIFPRGFNYEFAIVVILCTAAILFSPAVRGPYSGRIRLPLWTSVLVGRRA